MRELQSNWSEIKTILSRHGKTGGLGWVRVRFGSGQLGCGSKRVILNGLKMGLGQSGCGLGRVDTYFSHFFFIII